MTSSNTVNKIFGMFEKVDDIIYEPVKLVCDVMRQPLDTYKGREKQKLEKDIKEFEEELELDKKRREMELSIEQQKQEEEINQLIRNNDLANREKMIQMEVKYRKEMAEAATQLAQIMANIQVDARKKVLDLYEEKEKEYIEMQMKYRKDLYNSIKDIKEIFSDGSCDDIIKDELTRQLACIADRSADFSKLMNEDLKNMFGLINETVEDMERVAEKYFQPAQPNQPALTQKIVDSSSKYN